MKASIKCPTLKVDRLAVFLKEGMIPKEYSVVLWDLTEIRGDPIQNVAVGFLPPKAFLGGAPSDPEARAWVNWTKQWSHFHGWPVCGAYLQDASATPEGILASWIVFDGLADDRLKTAIQEMKARISGFSESRVSRIARQLELEQRG